MITRKEYFKKRWLYFIAIAFIFIVPFIILLEGVFNNNADKRYPLQLSVVIIGVVYFTALLKFFYKKIMLMKPSVGKIFLERSMLIVPLLTLACLVYLVEKIFVNFDFYLWMIVGSMTIGTFFEALEYLINRKFIYKWEIFLKAKEEVDRKRAEEEYRKVLEEIEHNE